MDDQVRGATTGWTTQETSVEHGSRVLVCLRPWSCFAFSMGRPGPLLSDEDFDRDHSGALVSRALISPKGLPVDVSVCDDDTLSLHVIRECTLMNKPLNDLSRFFIM